MHDHTHSHSHVPGTESERPRPCLRSTRQAQYHLHTLVDRQDEAAETPTYDRQDWHTEYYETARVRQQPAISDPINRTASGNHYATTTSYTRFQCETSPGFPCRNSGKRHNIF